jgi:hypothetical protein
MSGDSALTRWAAACAEHAIGQFARFEQDDPAGLAIAAAEAWAMGSGEPEASRDAAFEAQLAARETADGGDHALASAIRSAGAAAASIDDSRLAAVAATYAVEAIELSSAACELASRVAAELRWQWIELDEDLRSEILGDEPPAPLPSACAIDTAH